MMTDNKRKIQVAVVDDHTLLRTALAKLIDSFDDYVVYFEAENGEELKRIMNKNSIMKNK